MNGRQIRLFLAEGTPGGLTTAEIVNWTGHVVAAARSDLPALLKREEVGRTGVYLLLGSDVDTDATLAYIGEGDAVGKRLYQHSKDESKEFWDRAIVLTSKDLNLTKAHARYLESRFLAIAKEAGRAKITNSTAPDPIALPEADRSDMEFFISQARVLLPVLGVNILRPTKPSGQSEPGNFVPSVDVSPLFMIQEKKGADASAQEVDGEFIVREGSLARATWSGVAVSATKLRQQLEADGVLVAGVDGVTARFTQDVVFKSPSSAAAVVLGRSANGRTEWKLEDGKSYAAWQDSAVDALGTGQ